MVRTEIILAALRECRSEAEVEDLFNRFKDISPDIPNWKCNYLYMAMGNASYHDLPEDDDKRMKALTKMLVHGDWREPYEKRLVKDLISKYF